MVNCLLTDRLFINKKTYYNSSNSAFWGWLSMESPPQNPEFRNNPDYFHPCCLPQNPLKGIQYTKCWSATFNFHMKYPVRKHTSDKKRIQGECLLISNLPGKASWRLVDIARRVESFNIHSRSQAWWTLSKDATLVFYLSVYKLIYCSN